MNIVQAMRTIIESQGIEILTSPRKFQSMVMDYTNGCDQEKRLFNICCQNGILNIVYEMFLMKDKTKIEIMEEKIKDKLKHDAFMTDEYAAAGLNMLLQGMGMDVEVAALYGNEDIIQNDQLSVENLAEQETLSKNKMQMSLEEKNKINQSLFLKLKQAAEEGDEEALISLGNFYKNGIMVKKNWRMAEYYYRKAAEAGNREAKYNLVDLINEYRNYKGE